MRSHADQLPSRHVCWQTILPVDQSGKLTLNVGGTTFPGLNPGKCRKRESLLSGIHTHPCASSPSARRDQQADIPVLTLSAFDSRREALSSGIDFPKQCGRNPEPKQSFFSKLWSGYFITAIKIRLRCSPT